MAGNLGSLIVHLGADTASLQSDLGRANAIFQRDMAKMEKAASQMGRMVGVGLAAAGTAIAAMVKSSINNADELHQLSQKVGVSVEALSALQYQAGLAGVELAGLQTGMVKFSKATAEAAGGSKQQAAAFSAMGISLKDVQGNLRPTEELLKDVADKFAGYKDGAGKAALAVKLFGRAGADMIPMLNEGASGFRAAYKEAGEFGKIVSTEAAAAADQFNDNLDRLKGAAQGVANQIAADLLPVIVDLSNRMVEGSKNNSDMGRSVADLGSDLFSLNEFLDKTVQEVTVLTNVVAGAVNVFGGFGDVVTGALTNLGYSITSALKGATGDLAGAQQDFSLAGQAMAEGWEEGTTRIKGAWSSASTGIADATNGVKDFSGVMAGAAYSTGTFSDVVGGVGPIVKQTQAPILDFGSAAGGTKKKVEDLSEAIREFAADNLQLAADLAGPLAQAQEQYRSDLTEAAQAVLDGKASMDDYIVRQQLLASQLAVTSAELEKQGDVLGSVSADNADALDMVGMVGRQRAIKEAVKGATAEYLKNAKAGHVMADALEFVQAGADAGAVALYDAQKQASELENILSQFDNLDFGGSFVDQIKKVGEELKKATDPEQVERLSRALEELRKKQIVANTSAFLDLGQAIVGGMKESAEEGSRTMAALEIASAGLAMAQGILAILTQGQGDPYSAFARMAAMAALVIPLVAQVGGAISMASGAGFSDTAAQRQASQGTGTILGDAEAKSESIANAIEITADATTTLVGLNRGMLNALQALQKGLSGAGGLLARGAGEADFSGMDLAVGGAGSGLFDGKGILGRLLTGSSKITDQGIIIFGGALNDMLESIAVGAYQEVQSRSWAFGSTQTNEGVVDISDEFGKQFTLVMQSIADTVREGALALGLLPADIEAAMAAYQVETIRISLKDLSAEEQQAELEAVFSSIFDGLAGAVVPFIEQFQQVGEGLGETLVRVATEVQVAQEAFRQLGLSVTETDPERFAQISDSLIQAAGGLEAFISGMQSFVENFSTESYQLNVASEELSSAFSQVGLAVPDTREEMWALMQTLDATTEAGQQQIATLLRLAGVADEYYSLLDDQAEAFNNIGGDVEKFREAISQIAIQMQASIKHANDLARANGAEGASTEELTQIHSRAAALFAKVLAQLRQAAQELAFSMGLTDIGGVGQIDAEIARLEGMAGDATQPIRDFGSAMQTAAQQASDAVNLLLGDLSNLNDQQKLQKALEGLRAGTVSQEQVLEIGRRLYASTQQYNDLFAMVQQYGRPASGTSGGGGPLGQAQSGGRSADDTARLEALYEQRDAAMAQQDYLNAQTLASQIAEISEASGDDYMQVVEEMGIDAAELAERLHLDNVEQLDQLIERYQEATDSAGQQSTILADLLRDILATLRGEETMPSGRSGRSDPSAGSRSREDAEVIGEAVGRHMTRALMTGHGSQRNVREPVSRGR